MAPDEAPSTEAALDQLLRRWQTSGDREALDQLLRSEVTALKARIRAHGYRSLGADVSVSDVAQEAVMRWLRVETPPRFDTPQALRAYLWKAAWHLLAERLRRGHVDAAEGGTSMELDNDLATTGGLGGVEQRDRELVLDLVLQ